VMPSRRVADVIGPLFGLVLRYGLSDFKVPMLIWSDGLHQILGIRHVAAFVAYDRL
jgi:hypothetical protein